MGKGKPNKNRPKKHNYCKMQRLKRQREALTKSKGKSSNESLSIPSDVSSQCVEHTTTSLGSSDAVITTEKDNLTSALEVYMKSSYIPELNIDDVLIVRSNESMLPEGETVKSAVGQSSDDALETNIEDRLITSSKESGIFQCKKEESVENELRARSSAADQSFRSFTAIKQETPDPEFVSMPEEIPITEAVSVPAESPVTEFASAPDYCQCPNPKCLESISRLKKKESGLEFQLRESLRMSGEMYSRLQSILVEKKMLESKLQISEKEVSDFKKRYNRFFVSR